MQTLVLFTILALVASPIFAEGEVSSDKKVDKRGILGIGYGGYNGYYGLNGYGGYGHHGYLNAPVYSVGHGVAPSYSHAYSAPHVSLNHGYSAPIYTIPRIGYHSVGHGLNYLHGW